jgi:hypothetical protein
MELPTKVNYKVTSNMYEASKWLNDLPDLIACDFEAASKFTQKEKNFIKYKLDNYNLSFEDRRVLNQQYNSNGLSHPSLTVLTHFSVAWSTDASFVIILNDSRIREFVIRYLISTESKQLWHNCSFDFKHIYYLSSKLPINYIDTQLLAKSLLNNANPFKDRVGLKELMGYKYGQWQLSKDNFVLEEMYKEETLRYAATDSCATYALYESMLESLEAWRI